MKHFLILPALCVLLAFTSCDNKKKEKEADQAMDAQETEMVEEEMGMNINTDSLVMDIDKKREMTEADLGEPVEMSTADLRGKTKQKWEKIHFYTKDGQVVRIKTYPYAAISKRTEEFYFNNGNLVLAVVEDDGSKESEEESDMDKMYYFHDGEPIKEVNNAEGEKEYNTKDSDAEELHQEAKEYMDLYNNREKE